MLRFLLFLILCGTLAGGCAGYRLGPTTGQPAGAQAVQVNFFKNQTFEPRLVEAVNSSLRSAVLQDGTFRLDTRGEADIAVDGVIVRFERSPLSFQPSDILSVLDYRLLLVARVTAVERPSGKVLMNREIVGETTARVGPDLSSIERQSIPLLANDLARKTISLLAEGDF